MSAPTPSAARRVTAPAAALVALAAAAAAAAPPAVPSGAEHVMQEGHAPTPFSAREIREGCPDGRRVRFRTTPGPDAAPFETELRFVDGDAEAVMVENIRLGADGLPIGEPRGRRSPWEELQAHASFPSAGVTITPVEGIESPIGPFDGWLYEVRNDVSITNYWFATSLPGPPVHVVSLTPDGKVMFEMVMMSSTVEATAESAGSGS